MIGAGLLAIAAAGWWLWPQSSLSRLSERLEVEVARELARAGVRGSRLIRETRTLQRARPWAGYALVEKTYAAPAKFSPPAFVRDLQRELPPLGFTLRRVDRRHAPEGVTTVIDLGTRHHTLYRLALQEPAMPPVEGPLVVAPGPAPPGATAGRAKVAIVLDDWGYSAKLVPEVLKLSRPVTLAILPHQRYSTAIDQAVRGSRCEVILHMPMEPKDARSPREPHVLASGMPSEAVRRMLASALATVPSARGVSNHQGSKATEDLALMRTVMDDLRARRLFFLDSVTASDSACPVAARDAGVPFAQRAVFLDNQETPAQIQRRLRELVAIARRAGSAVGIGHDKRVTLEVLREAMPQYEQQGVDFVPLSAVEQTS